MRPEALEYLRCPVSGDALELTGAAPAESDGHLMSGTLVSRSGRRYPIVDGIPNLTPEGVESLKSATASRFADEWLHWRDLRHYYEQQFLGWVSPVGPEDFRGKVVFEGGCGKGRHSAVVAGYGAKAVVAIDLGESATVAFAHTRALKNVHIAIGDLLAPPVARVFDLAFSVGVIHHLPDPSKGFTSLSTCVKRGGRVVVWVYGKENNEWITTFVDPVRKALTARMSPALLRPLSAVPSAALWAAIKLFYRPGPGGKGPRLPYGQYFASMHGFPFDEIHSIVFDQLVTPVAYYLQGDEVRRWFESGFEDVEVRWHREYSWTGTAKVAS
jgi:SAM-dependent methyltransferase